MSGRGHQLIHSDALSAELEALGLDSSLFGAAGIPAPIFQALVPRRAGVFDEHAHTFGTGAEPAAFTRASNGIYLDSDGVYQIAAANTIRAEYSAAGAFLGYLCEPAITNKCTNYNAAPDAGLSGMATTGGPGETLSRVDATAALAAAGLSAICPNGQVFQFETTTNSANCIVDAATGNTNPHTMSAWVRKVSGANHARLQGTDGGGQQPFSNTAFERVISTWSPLNAATKWSINCGAGVVCQFVLNQLEEASVATSPIIAAGASATRAVDGLIWNAAPDGFSHDAGTLGIDIDVTWTSAFVAPSANWGGVTLSNSLLGLFYFGAANLFKSYDGANGVQLSIDRRPALHRVFLRWSASSGQMELVAHNPTDGWRTSAGTYKGTFTSGGAIDRVHFYRGGVGPLRFKNFALWNRDLGAAMIQKLYTP